MFTFEIKDQAVTAALIRTIGALECNTALMRDIGEILADSTQARFAKGTAPDGSKSAAKS